MKISFGTAGGLVSLRKRWKGKSPRGTEEPQKEEHCEMKGTKAKGVEEKMMNMKRKSERTKEKERTKSEKAEEQEGGQEGSGFIDIV